MYLSLVLILFAGPESEVCVLEGVVCRVLRRFVLPVRRDGRGRVRICLVDVRVDQLGKGALADQVLLLTQHIWVQCCVLGVLCVRLRGSLFLAVCVSLTVLVVACDV